MRIVHLLPAVVGAGLLFAVPVNAQAARNYDCSKAGNANKTVCRQQAAAAKAVAPSAMSSTARHYDCTKAGNANKAVCKGVAATTPVAAPPAAPVAPAAPTSRAATVSRSTSTRTVSTSTTSTAAGPNGATAVCRDGTYSHSAHHSGSCSHHGGVKQFY